MIASFPRTSSCGVALGLALLLGFAAGCGNRNAARGPGPESALQEAPQSIQNAFKQAKPELKAAADEVVTALESRQTPKAFLQLQQLSSRTDLTAGQSVAAARAAAAVRAQLAAAAARGDKAALDLLEAYHNSK